MNRREFIKLACRKGTGIGGSAAAWRLTMKAAMPAPCDCPAKTIRPDLGAPFSRG
jgi:hypothetical protein